MKKRSLTASLTPNPYPEGEGTFESRSCDCKE